MRVEIVVVDPLITFWSRHTRQLMLTLENLGITPDGPLTDADVAALPLPENVGDKERSRDESGLSKAASRNHRADPLTSTHAG